jgi:acetate kinase
MKILVLNAGSSSHKCCLFDLTHSSVKSAPLPIWRGQLDWTHQEGMVELLAQTDAGESIKQQLPLRHKRDGIEALLNTLVEAPTQILGSLSEIDIVGHRVVHGGRDYQNSVLITEDVKAAIRRLISLAPSHNPANLDGIETLEAILEDVPQVAMFDTAFHARMPEAAYVYPGPYSWLEQGIRRYGFHGISHQYVAERAAQILERDLTALKLLTCHLGNGCSLAAIKDGYSIDTTMGFTPLDGLMMGSRSGTIDPGILIHLIRHKSYTADQLDYLLNRASGLKGLSGLSNDLRLVTEAREQNNRQAQLAIDVFIHRLRQEMGSMIASLGGLDVIVFTAGIGENSPMVWQQACAPFQFMGVKLKDYGALSRSTQDQDIAAPDSDVSVLVIHTQEEWAIAQACLDLTSPSASR